MLTCYKTFSWSMLATVCCPLTPGQWLKLTTLSPFTLSSSRTEDVGTSKSWYPVAWLVLSLVLCPGLTRTTRPGELGWAWPLLPLFLCSAHTVPKHVNWREAPPDSPAPPLWEQRRSCWLMRFCCSGPSARFLGAAACD